MIETDVLIVGGGLAGLALADHLNRAGTDFLLIEAQARLGGRILTQNVSGANFDLGPAWFWPGQPRMQAMINRFSIPVFEQYSTGDLMFQDRTGAVQRGRGYASMQGSYRLEGGMGALVDALSRCLPEKRLMLETRLSHIQHKTGDITAQLSKHDQELSIQAKQIVLALPPRVVAETVKFDPELTPSQIQAMSNVPTWMAGQAKILAIYDQPYWRQDGLSGDAMSHRGPMVEIHDASPISGGPYALFGFVGVPADIRVVHQDQLLQAALSQLVEMFGPKMSQPLDLFLQDWATVPEIATQKDRTPAGHHPRYGTPTTLKQLTDAGIHFASTEAAPEFGGFLEGALEAAESMAETIAKAIPAKV